MHRFTFRLIFIATAALALLSVVVFWSFNELSDLFGGPQAQFKHAVAAIGFLLVIKLTMTRFRGGHGRSSIKNRHLDSSRGGVHDL